MLSDTDLVSDINTLRARQHQLDILAARSSSAELGRQVYPGWQSVFYLDVISDYLEACLRYVRGQKNGLRRILVNCPFQHAKTTIVEMFVARALGVDPSLRIVSATYNIDYSKQRIVNTQRFISHPKYQAAFSTQFGQTAAVEDDDGSRRKKSTSDKVQNSANMYQVRALGPDGKLKNFGGSFLSTSLGSGLNGRPFEIGIIDDPHKDEESVASETERTHIEERYDTIFESREGPRSVQILVSTRMGAEDLAGYVLPRWQKAGIPHAVLRFPAIQDEESPADYDPRPFGWGLSQALPGTTAEIKNAEWYRAKKALVQPWTWETCWQQRPTTRAGELFRNIWWREYDPAELKEVDRYWISIDCAAKAIGASWTCADLWAARGPQAFKIDELRGHWDVRQFERELMNWITDKWGREVRRQGSAILIEDGGFGRTIHDDLQAAGVDSLHLLGTGGLSKQARASMVLDFVRNGLAHLPSRSFGRVSSGWVEEHKTEYGRFPAPPCDRVDAGVQALRWHLDILRGSD